MTKRRPADAGLLSLVIDGAPVPVTIVRSSRRTRTVSFSVGGGGIVVRSPEGTPVAFIRNALELRSEWIGRQLAAQQRRPAIEDGGELPYLGGSLRLSVRPVATRRRCTVRRADDVLEVTLPESLEGTAIADVLSGTVAAWYRSEGARFLPGVADHLIRATGLQPAGVLVCTQRSRWGSCAADGTIRLSWRLMMLPEPLVEDVVLHELTHLQHKHHGPAFWAALEKLAPGARQRARELRRMSRALPRL